MLYVYALWIFSTVIYSFGFIDRNLPFITHPVFQSLQQPLGAIIYEKREWAGLLYIVFISGLFICYLYFLRNKTGLSRITSNPVGFFLVVATGFILSFPALSYDIFNYMTTARIAFLHQENPYIVMPVEIPNEPWLAFTRGANKVALYGPTWLVLTWLPYVFGFGHIVATIYSFKILILIFYLIMLRFIYIITNDLRNVIFFALNPLVLIEVLVSAHNDIVMMVLALGSLIFVQSEKTSTRLSGYFLYILSVFVKGATLVLFPMVFIFRLNGTKLYVTAWCLMFAAFLASPFREELYPWYAVWFLSFAAIIPITKDNWMHSMMIAISIGLTLRHLPYIVTREYGGFGPMVRLFLTIIPPLLYTLFMFIRLNILLPFVKNQK